MSWANNSHDFGMRERDMDRAEARHARMLDRINLSSGGKAEHLEEARPRMDERPAPKENKVIPQYASLDAVRQKGQVNDHLPPRDIEVVTNHSERSASPTQFTSHTLTNDQNLL